jgi:hypothetical protein
MSTSPLPRASLENEHLRVEYLTTAGPRITGLYVRGVAGNLLAETPDEHWPTPHGEFHLLGGHRLWTAPEDPFYTCPDDHVNIITEKDTVTLQSNVDPAGLEKEISFRLDQNRVLLSHRVTWHGNEPIELAPWGITQLRLGGMAILPLSRTPGLAPNRNLVFWPHTHIHDERLELHDDLVLLFGRASERPFKLGNYNTHGWLAYLLKDALFVKRFSSGQAGRYPDMGSNVEAYVKDSCLELETLGPLTMLQPGASVALEETWEVRPGQYATTLEDARIISRQLSPD